MVSGGFAVSSSSYDEDSTRWSGVAKVLGPKWAQMPLSTIGMAGLSIIWSVEMSNAPAYLLTLGMSRASMSIVFLAGPLSGLIVQPLVGALADASTSSFGRRRPYILGGAVLCGMAMLLLGFTRDVASWFTRRSTAANDGLTIALAVFAIYCIDFSVNAVQAADRAILVDVWPRDEQERGNAWAARMGCIGSIAGFFIGNVDLTRVLPFFGSTQIEILSVFSLITLVGLHLATCWAVKERVQLAPPSDPHKPSHGRKKRTNPIRTLIRDVKALPRTIRQICMIQFFVWIAWFPVMFYTSVYVGDIYKRSEAPPVAADGSWTQQMIEDEATREGSRALFYNAIVSLIGTLILPFCILEEREQHADSSTMRGNGWISSKGSRWRKPTLTELWAGSHALFALCMASTWWISSVWAAQMMMAVLGLCSAMGAWAPFSLLGQAILAETKPHENERDIALRDRRTDDNYDALPAADEEHYELQDARPGNGLHSRKSNDSIASTITGSEDEGESTPRASRAGNYRRGHGTTPSLGSNPFAQVSHANIALNSPVVAQREENDDEVGHSYASGGPKEAGIAAKGGSILGIHNVFVVIPQFVASGISGLVFAILEPDRSTSHPGVHPAGDSLATRQEGGSSTTGGSDALGFIFRFGGVSSLVACALCYRLAKELRKQ